MAMTKIDAGEWKEFQIGELFPKIRKPPVLHNRQVIEDEHGIPYIVRTKFNNGLKFRVRRNDDMIPSPAGVISFGAENATFFYQPEEFVSGRDIYYIDTRALSAGACMFLTACLQPVARKYSYSYGLFPDLLKSERIKLPADQHGSPDWAYMDSFMEKVMKESEACLENKMLADEKKTAVDISQWKEFKIGELFDKLNLGIKNPDFNKILDVSEKKTDEFSLPLVNAKHGNNGIMFYGRKDDFDTASMAIDIVQNGAVATGDVYAQPQETGVLWDAYLIKPKCKIESKYSLMFLAVVMERAIKERFGYDDKCVWDKASQLNVMLPVDSYGRPNWAYMDSFMMKVMKESEANLENLKLVLGI